jgi:uncharacterized protein with von Willebrand factor type A (vWA) domain
LEPDFFFEAVTREKKIKNLFFYFFFSYDFVYKAGRKKRKNLFFLFFFVTAWYIQKKKIARLKKKT